MASDRVLCGRIFYRARYRKQNMPDDTYFALFQERPLDQERLALPQDLVVRSAGPQDREGLAALKWERNGGEYEAHLRFFDAALIQSEGCGVLLVVQCGDRLVGYGQTSWFECPPEVPPKSAPSGWYLLGLLVTPTFRRHGIGTELTRRRLQWIAERASEAFYFANAQNPVTIALHKRFGFAELTRDFVFPHATFSGGVGILYRVDLSKKP